MDKKIYVLIPARSGSKSLPNKNIKLYNGKPLLVHSIEVAQKSKYINPENIYVSTDSEEYAMIAAEYGAKVPFLRPITFAGDLSTDLEVFHHMNMGLFNMGIDLPDIWIHLRPTYPNRSVELLDRVIEIFLGEMDRYTSLRTVVPIDLTPYKMYHIDEENNELKPIFLNYNGYKEPYNQCRQIFPQTYVHNGCIDIIKNSVIDGVYDMGSMTGDRIYPYIMDNEELDDIDTEKDFKRSENKVSKN